MTFVPLARPLGALLLAISTMACGGSEQAVDGPPCPEGEVRCGTACVNVRTSKQHCGACGQVCGANIGCFAGTCTSPEPMQQARAGHALIVGPDGRMYAIGGGVGSYDFTDSVEVYDFETNHWEAAAPLLEERAYLGAAVYDGRILAIGGATEKPGQLLAFGSVFSLYPGEPSWSSSADLSAPRADAAVATDAVGKVWAIWGWTVKLDEPSTTVETLGLEPMWQAQTLSTAPVPPRWGARAVTSRDGRIHLLGGVVADGDPMRILGCRRVEVLDPSTRELTPSAHDLLIPHGIGAAVLGADGRVYYFGGVDAHGDPRAEVEVHDPDAPDLGWSFVEPLPVPLSDTAAVRGPDGRIYVVGGVAPDAPAGQVIQNVFVYDPERDEWYL